MEWISVKKELPPALESVVVYCQPKQDIDTVESYCEVTAYNELANEWCMKPMHPHEITHWMKLPETPQ